MDKKSKKSKSFGTGASRIADGVLWLSLAGVLVKLVGLVFKIPLTNMIGDSGMGYFNSAYTVFTFFYTLSSAGLPVALSISVSSCLARGENSLAKKTFSVAVVMFSLLGVLLAAGMLAGSAPLANAVSNPLSRFAIAAMAPSLLFVCVSGAYRGYFQGRSSMSQTAISQIIEALGKLIFGISFAYYALNRGLPSPVVAAFAVLGITLSEALSLIYLIIAGAGCKRIPHLRGDISAQRHTRSSIAKRLAAVALPIGISSAVMSLSGLLDLGVVMNGLQRIGYRPEASNAMFGAYTSLAVPMFNMPAVLITPIASAIVPYISSALAEQNRKKASAGAINCLKYATVIAMPSALGLSALARPILSLFFDKELARTAAPWLEILAIAIILVAYTNVSLAVMQSSGHTVAPVVIMTAGGAVKVISAYFAIEKYGMAGTPISSVICYGVMSVLAFAFLDKKLGIKIKLLPMTLIPLIASVICASSARMSYAFFYERLGSMAVIAAIGVGAVLYFAALLVFGYVKKEDLKMLSRREGNSNK